MEGLRLLFVKLVIMFIGRSSAAHCDRATTAQVRAGNLGQSGDFNWLGVLHVHLHDEHKIRVAMTGIILVKIKYALANADDVVRIPRNIFKSDSKAMFLAARDTPWYAKPESYVTHPEYEYSTLNTIAVVKLNLDDNDDFPLNPICIPTGDTFNTSRYLYLTGFTDENQKMEKVIYNIQYLEKQVCEEFYNRAGLSSQKRIPSVYLCGYAPSNVTQCVWDNGMALVSNVTGYFYLIGFGIHGPGCAAPARFIDLFPYFSWINSVTSPYEVYDDGDRFRRMKEDNKYIPNVPIQELYTKKGSRRYDDVLSHHNFERYPFDVDALKFHLIEPSMEDENTLLIIPLNDTWQEHEDACSKPAILMYQEYFELSAEPGIEGTAIYKLSLYDKAHATCSCVRLTTHCRERSGAMLSFKEEINLKENTEFTENSWETPKEVLKYFPINERKEKPKTKLEFKDDIMLSEPGHIEDSDMFPRTVMNYDLYIKFEFTARAVMEFEMFAKPFNRSVGWLLPTTSKITTTMRETTTMTETTTMKETTAMMETTTVSETSKATTTSEPSETTTTSETSEATTTSETSETTTISGTSETTTTSETSETTTPAEVTTTTEPVRKKAKSRVNKRLRSHWGMANWADKMLKETEVSVVSDVEEVQETESEARSEGAPGAVVMVCCLVSACLRRAFFVY